LTTNVGSTNMAGAGITTGVGIMATVGATEGGNR
jgi:hypothetical protein